MNAVYTSILSCAMAALAAAGLCAAPPDDDFKGLTGAEITERVRSRHRPPADRPALSPREIWASIYRHSALEGEPGCVFDYFSDASAISIPPADMPAPPDALYGPLGRAEWWAPGSETPQKDLHNIIHGNAAEMGAFLGMCHPPGEALTAWQHKGELWGYGSGPVGAGGPETNLYVPPKGREGDFARILMYCAAAYPSPFWREGMFIVFAEGGESVLTAHGRRMLSEWHRRDPVDERERRRDAEIERIQGNYNPFVRHEELAEYAFGRYAGLPYPGAETPQPEALRGRYSLGKDSHISLHSPYIAEGMEWKIDGVAVGGDRIATAGLAEGPHLLTYASAEVSGELTIMIEP